MGFLLHQNQIKSDFIVMQLEYSGKEMATELKESIMNVLLMEGWVVVHTLDGISALTEYFKEMICLLCCC